MAARGDPTRRSRDARRARERRLAERRARGRRRLAALIAGVIVIVIAIVLLAGGGGGSSPGGGGEQTAAQGGGGGGDGEEAKPVKLTVEANGDLLIHSPVWYEATQLAGGSGYDFAPMLAKIKPYVKGADLAICHVETPIGDGPPSGYPIFNAPAELARAIKQTGWKICDTASNHSLDKGVEGIRTTAKALDDNGILHTGSFTSQAASRKILTVTVKGVKVAFLAYTEMTNGIPLPHPWSVNMAKAPKILADARRARRAGAQVVIVNMHWGEEYQSEPSDFQQTLARKLTASDDITAVIGQHVHVVQPIEPVDGKLVVFGEGNLLSNQTPACCATGSQDGLLALLHIVVRGKDARVSDVEYVPTWVRHPDYTVVVAGKAAGSDDPNAAAEAESYKRTVQVVGKRPHVQPIPRRLP